MPDLPPSIASFTVRGGPLDGKRLDVDDAVDEILVGSDVDCRFCLELPGVSPIHARVWMDLDGVVVHDTHSPRGVYVNDDRVKGQAPLRDRDILWLGPPGGEASVMIECRLASAGGDAPVATASGADALADLVDAPPVAAPRADRPAPPPSSSAPVAADALADLVAPDPIVEPAVVSGPADLVGSPDPGPASSGFDFFVEEPAQEAPSVPEPAPAGLDDLLVMDPEPAPIASAPPPAVAIPTVADAADEGFFVRETPEPVQPPLEAGGGEDVFFVDDSPSGGAAEEPFLLDEEPAAAPPPLPPAPPAKPPAAVTAAAPARPASPSPPVPPSAPRATAPPARPEPEPPPVPPAPLSRQPPAAAPSPITPATAAPAPAPARRPPAPSPAPRPAAARPAAAAVPTPRVAPASRGGVPKAAKLGGVAAAGLVVAGGIAFVLSRSASAPKLEAASPARVAPGQTLTLTGRDFAPQPQGNVVRFQGGPSARVLKATPTELQVEVPDVPGASGRPTPVAVTVVVGGRESAPAQVTVFQAPRIHGVSPSVAMPGEEVTLAGTGWGLGARVRFGTIEAPVVSATPTALRVRVPEGAGAVGTSIPVVVSMGADASNPFQFLVGRLPLITGVEPATASAGDVVSVAGRGFNLQPGANAVKIGGAAALVVSSADADLKAVVPRGAAPGPGVPVEVKVADLDNTAHSTLTVSPPLDPVDFGFAAEPFVDAAGHEHAVLTTGLGPAFVLSAAGGRSAGERAVEAARRLAAAAGPLRASRGEDLEVRGVDSDPVIVLMGKSDPILQVTEEDAAAYNEDWMKLGGKGGPVTRGRLALWWGALARDLVLMLVRGETPRHTAGLAPEGKVLVDLFESARQAGRFGIPVSVVESARPATRDGLRLLGLRVPAAVVGPPGPGGPAPAATTQPGVPVLRLDGVWTGVESDPEGRKFVTVRFSGTGGSLSYQRALSVSVPLTGVEQPRRDTLRYSVKTATGTRFYVGRWDGARVTGTIFSDAANTFPIGSFDIAPER